MSLEPLVLPDVNVWLATLTAAHPHHARAAQWWRDEAVPAGCRVAFCRLTQLGLLRLLTKKTVMGPQRRTTAQAWAEYETVLAQGLVTLAPEPDGVDEILAALCTPSRSSMYFWSDAYLAAFAMAAGARLVTFDGGFKHFEDLETVVLE